MIKVLFGKELPHTLSDVDVYFKNTYDFDWFEDDIVKQMVKEIDDSELVGNCLVSPYLGNTSPENMSGGVKALILLLKDDSEFRINLTFLGRNCQKWLSYITSIKDIEVSMTGVDLTMRGYPIEGICLNDGSEIKIVKTG
jgi:hypothetical protein